MAMLYACIPLTDVCRAAFCRLTEALAASVEVMDAVPLLGLACHQTLELLGKGPEQVDLEMGEGALEGMFQVWLAHCW